jgi:hypothetical protein
MTGHSLKLTGTAAVVPLSATPLNAKWIQYLADTANVATILIGGTEVSSTVGFPLVPGAAQFYPTVAEWPNYYDLSLQNVYLPSGAVLHILYGV